MVTRQAAPSVFGPFGPPPDFFIPDATFSLYLNGTPVPPAIPDVGQGNPIKQDPVFFEACGLLPCPYGPPILESISWPIDHIPTNFAEFTFSGPFASLNRGEGTPAISGYVVDASTVVPLPAALPLFGSGLIALAGFAVRRRGKVS
jgi:hypothetical protein